MMSPSNWEQVRALFHTALERAPDERAAFLRSQSSDDEIVREVASLLAAHADAAALLDAASREKAQAAPARAAAATRRATLTSGVQLGPYVVVSPLGAGAMGEVYRARDTNLRRDVALKILPEALAADPDRLARFTREARTLGALNHPHIAQVYGFEQHGDVRALVMELVEGQDLAVHIARGAIRVAEALQIARQIAEALEAAHARGIVHRDLKPANIMIREDGTVKVLDFGLAKGLMDDLGSATPPVTPLAAPAIATAPPIATEVGVLVGTAAYMSPEQARGGAVDKGSDIWAFGCVLYEMLTGTRAFDGANAAEAIGNVLQHDPAWDRLPTATPPAMCVMLHRCLRKDRRERLQDAAGVRIEIDDALRNSEKDPVQVVADDRHYRSRGRRKAIHSLAMLPLANVGADPNTEYLGEGITESVINSLSQLPRLRVIALTSAIHHARRGGDPQEVGKELGVGAVLTGKVLHIDDRLVIRTELVDVADGARLWGQQYNRQLDDILAVQDEIAQEIVERLCLHLTSVQRKQLTKKYTSDIVAYQHYLRGRYQWSKRTAAGFNAAVEAFEQAIARDPAYALAYAGIADCYAILPFYDQGAPMQFYHKAKAAATRALEIDKALPEAHVALGHIQLFYDWDWAGARRELKRGIALAPSNSEAHHVYAYYFSTVGRVNDAIQEVSRSLECDPVSLPANVSLGVMFYFARHYDKAIEQLLKTVDLNADFASAHAILGWAYAERGLHEQAIAACERALAFDDAPWILASLGYAFAVAGRTDAAAHVLELMNERAKHAYVSPYDLAVMCGVMGKPEQALAHLEEAYEERSGVLVWGLQSDPRLDGLRGDTRFVQLLRRVGLAPEDNAEPPRRTGRVA